MRRIIVKEARPGMVAARSVADPNAPAVASGSPGTLAVAGDVLTEAHLVRFHEAGVYELWVDDPGLDFLDDLYNPQGTVAERRLADALRDAILRVASWVPRDMIKHQGGLLRDTLQQVLHTAAGVPCCAAMADDASLLDHSCEVLAVATLLGLHLEEYLVEQRRRLVGRKACDVVNLALGALFHDVGELALPAEQRESQVAVAGLETGDWKRHTAEGFAMVRGRIDPSAAGVVLHHHQHFDGSGFGGLNTAGDSGARPLAGADVHVFARIVMVADWFCQSVFSNGSRLPQPLVRTLWEMQQTPQRHAFDPVVYQALMALFPPFAEGTIVTLNDGRQALVTRAHAAYPCYPEVHIIRDTADASGDAPSTTDLAERLDVAIQAEDNTSIEHYLFGMRKVHPLIAA
jgi:hypothetical protein